MSSRRSGRAPRPSEPDREQLEQIVHLIRDVLGTEVLGAARAGMKTVQALWFRADDVPVEVEPDFQAFTQMDVLNVIDRLLA
ncbi:MAG: hypothetical protein K0S82_1107, partial [Gaiellaceae bacterium]|nr:hypothetical protein [Gaiellaceae bacterium]